jgi:hypothetical protein
MYRRARSLQQVARRDRSIWTGDNTADLVEVEVPVVNHWGWPAGKATFRVEPGQREEFLEFSRFLAQRGRWFLPALLACVAVAVVAAVLDSQILAASAVGLIGLTILVLPFATPQTVAMIGWQKSILLARGLGLAVMILGIVLGATGAR